MQTWVEENVYVSLFQALAVPVILFDTENRISKLNPAALELLYGSHQSEVLLHAKAPARDILLCLRRELEDHISGAKSDASFEKVFETCRGRRVFEVKLKRLLGRDCAFQGSVAMLVDLTEGRRAEEMGDQFKRVAEQHPHSIVVTDPTGNIEYVNAKFVQVSGYLEHEVLGRNPRILKSCVTPPEKYQELWKTIIEGREWQGELQNRRKNGELFWESVNITPIRGTGGEITHYLAIEQDITARKAAEAERDQQIAELKSALDKVKTLSGLLPICASCKKIRDDKGCWNQLEAYIQQHSEVQFSHGLCQECLAKLYPELNEST
ncbi:MAG: PAS domain S-box protein [Candidatus Omnitrophica bacterium]|nr:PAS domain S-box protein [Candidatus Omnitrophota bacterium]